MSNTNDFVISNGKLEKYIGSGGNVLIPDSVSRIMDWAFYNCSCLTSVVIPYGVTEIGNNAFSGCRNLKSVAIPDSMTSIGNDAFKYCRGLSSLVIPDGVTRIGTKAFYDCSGLTSVSIPNTVTRIGDEAFRGCNGLANADGFVLIRNVLYEYGGNRKDVVIPEGVTGIGGHAFYYQKITNVEIPEGVASIGEEAFSGCSELKRLVLPKSMTSIGDHAFDGCGKIEYVIAPSVDISNLSSLNLGISAAFGFLSNRELFSDYCIISSYQNYCISQRKKLLLKIIKNDSAVALSFFIKENKVTRKNFDADYFVPALQAGAEKCKALLLDWKEKQ